MKKARGKTKALFAVFIGLLLVGLFSVGQPAAEMTIEVQDFGQIKLDKSRLWSPGRLAVGGDGTLYVVDSYKNRILMFDRNGNSIGNIFSPQVSAVAVASDGTLYVGSHASYSVSIIRNGRIAGYLGKGANEFKSVMDIAVDNKTGMVYVADTSGNAVRMFSASGSDRGAIAGVHLPVSVEIAGDAVFVLDTPVLLKGMPMSTASRITVFDKGHNILRTINEYGADAGLIMPTDIAVADGVIYITDCVLKTVVLYDTAGTYLGEISDAHREIQVPVAIGLSPDGIVYVSSSETHSIQMFGLRKITDVRVISGVRGY